MDEARLAAIRAAYDAVAPAYAARFLGELEGKPLDRALLSVLAEAVGGAGRVVDLGAGSGHVARALHERGVAVFGVDLSPASVALARETHRDRGIEFMEGDFFALALEDGALAGAVAFYAYVHLAPSDLPTAFREVARVLRPGAPFLVCFHVGEERLHLDEWLGARVDLDWQLFPIATITAALEGAGLKIEVKVERAAYPDEYPTVRGYVIARRR